jgi:hypothetical protein
VSKRSGRGARFAVLMAGLLALSASPAVAQSNASDVAQDVQNQGYFIESGASINADEAGLLVGAARAAGEELFLVFLSSEPSSGATFFAESVVNALPSGFVLVVAPESVGYSGETSRATEVEVETALDNALNAGGSDFDIAATFVNSLPGIDLDGTTTTAVPTASTAVPTASTAVPTASTPASSSGGGSGLLWIVVIVVIGGGIFLFLRSRKSTGSRGANTVLGKAKAEVQKMLSAVANDLLDMEEEVRSANNDRADRFYQDASATYSKSSEAFEAASTPQQLLDLSNGLELAIWQLDSAEAILDGNEPPTRPEPKKLDIPAPRPTPSTQPRRPSGPSQVPPRPDYNRRSTRRSAPMGGGLMDLLMGALGSGMLSAGGSRGSRRSPSPRRSRVSPRAARRSSSSRSSGSAFPSPTRRGSTTRTRSSRRSGGSGKRIRGGGRRRK